MTPPANQDDYYAQVKATGTSGTDDKKPLKLKLKAVVKKPTEEEAPKVTEPVSQIPETPVVVERPKARLVEREHASSGLMRSVMRGNEEKDKGVVREKSSFPKISFTKVESKVKVLENRPVMKLPDEVPKRRTDGAFTPSSSTGPKRLRDDAKPMFQRNIGFATPSKDGTAKKGGKGK